MDEVEDRKEDIEDVHRSPLTNAEFKEENEAVKVNTTYSRASSDKETTVEIKIEFEGDEDQTSGNNSDGTCDVEAAKANCEEDIKSLDSEDGNVSVKSDSTSDAESEGFVPDPTEHSNARLLPNRNNHSGGCSEQGDYEHGYIYDDSAARLARDAAGENENASTEARFPPSPLGCEFCGKSFTNETFLLRHKQYPGQCAAYCELCNKYFYDRKSLRRHRNTHVQENWFACEVCGKYFSMMSYLRRHQITHSDLHPFSCKLCGKSFRHSGSLKRHISSCTDNRAYTCNFCQKTFTNKSHLDNHQNIHTQEREHPCKTCGKTFLWASSLWSHMQTHTDELQYTCEICHKSFKLERYLTRHKQKHSDAKPFTCQVCGRAFRYNTNLYQHVKTHSNERPFSCKYCEKSFLTKNCLERHTRIHTHERPFTCFVCKKSFVSTSHLTRHRRTHQHKDLECTSSSGNQETNNADDDSPEFCSVYIKEEVEDDMVPEDTSAEDLHLQVSDKNT